MSSETCQSFAACFGSSAQDATLPMILTTTDGLRTHSRDLLRNAIARLMAAGNEEATLRADVHPNDVLMALGGNTLIADNEHQRELASRLCDLLMDALTAVR